jgi:hypothetical protein
MRSFVIAATVAALVSFASAQRAGAAGHGGSLHAHPAATNFSARNARRSGFQRSSRFGPGYGPGYLGYGSLPFPFFGDNFDPDDIYSTGYPVASEPPPFLLQALQSLANPAANSMSSLIGPSNREGSSREGSSNDPLMIELQNGRYVRVNNTVSDDAEPITFANESASAKPHTQKEAKPTQPDSTPEMLATAVLPPAILIFRDGHSEEVRDYTIADGTLYARGDYYTDGYWNKKIDLANLNVPETLQANASRNIKFTLPSSPNEVITRP